MNFYKDPVVQSYERSVFSFLDLTGNLGGLFEVLQIVGSFMVGLFAGKTFLFSIISHLYQVDTYDVCKPESQRNRQVEDNMHKSDNIGTKV